MVYWPVLSKQELQARQVQLAKEEKERAALDGITTDKVICGEQQPESDHFIRMENSRTGDDEGVHWRETTGWFSYRMKTNGKPVHKVRIRFRSEIRKDAKVWINGQEVGRLAGKPVSDVSVGIFDVPASMQSNEQLEIKSEILIIPLNSRQSAHYIVTDTDIRSMHQMNTAMNTSKTPKILIFQIRSVTIPINL